MNFSPPDTGGWSWQRWAWIGAAGLSAHVALVFWFGARNRTAPTVLPPEPAVTFLVDSVSRQAVVEAQGLSDPTLFALPSIQGFSGEAWLRLPPGQPPAVPWTEPPQWLPLNTNELGESFARFVATYRSNGSELEDLLKPRSSRADILLINEPVMSQSAVTVEGPLAGRPLAVALAVPSWPYADTVENSVVHLKVDSDGLPESAILQESSGVKPLDDQALILTKALRFVPLSSRQRLPAKLQPLTWGKVTFCWHTVPPSATNAAAFKRE